MKALLKYHDLRVFFDEKKAVDTSNLQELADQTENIYQVIAVGATLNKKMHKKVQNFCAFEESMEGIYDIIRGYAEITKLAEPKFTEKTFRAYLYLVTESAILSENAKLLSDLSKIMKFEHPHLRIGFFIDNKEINKILVDGYNQAYIIAELT